LNQVAELLRVGRFEAAIALAARAAEAAPEAPDAWLMLAQAQLAARRPDAALAACDRGLAVAPGSAELACLKAAVLRSLARVDEALSLYDAVLAASPDHFEAGFACALLRLEAGDLAAAEAWLAGLDAHQVARAEARWLSARAAVAAGDVARARTELESFLARPDLSPARSADAWLLLAEALDGLGFPREAFAAVAKGKGLQRRLYAERAQGREAAAARFRRLAAWFAACDPQAWASAPPAAPRAAGHVFLVGFPARARRCWSRRSPAILASSRWKRRRPWPRPTPSSWDRTRACSAWRTSRRRRPSGGEAPIGRWSPAATST
jgi:tetratricopeptide (TPR) repeat protein